MLGDKCSPSALLPSAIAWFRAVAIGTTTGYPLVSERENWRAFLNIFIRHILDLVKYSVKLMFRVFVVLTEWTKLYSQILTIRAWQGYAMVW